VVLIEEWEKIGSIMVLIENWLHRIAFATELTSRNRINTTQRTLGKLPNLRFR